MTPSAPVTEEMCTLNKGNSLARDDAVGKELGQELVAVVPMVIRWQQKLTQAGPSVSRGAPPGTLQ